MAGYHYEALDTSGGLKSGVLNAQSAKMARHILRERGMIAVSVTQLSHDKTSPESSLSVFGGVSTEQLSHMTRQFASLLAARISIEKALNALIDQTESGKLRKALAGVRGNVLEGKSLAQSMDLYPGIFPELYRVVIAAGENSGSLDQLLLNLADHTERSQALKRRITAAFIYPAIVTGFALMVTTGLLVYIVPQVVAVFQRTHQALPPLTMALISLSEFLRSWGVLLAAAIVLGIWLLKTSLRNRPFRLKLHSMLLKTPVAGSMARSIDSARFSHTLATLVNGGVPIIQALKSCAGTVKMEPMRLALADAVSDITRGGSLSRSLEASKKFPPMLVHFVAGGEESGRLGEMIDRAAAQQAKDLEYRITVATSFVEPALVICTGAVVLVIVLAVLMPIFDMNLIVR